MTSAETGRDGCDFGSSLSLRRGSLVTLTVFTAKKVLPKIGGIISGDAAAYAYLPEVSGAVFPSQRASRIDGRSGLYEKVRYVLMMLKSVAIHIGVKA